MNGVDSFCQALLAAILRQRGFQLLRDRCAESRRCHDLDFRTVTQNVHEQLAVVPIRKAQLIASVGEELADLFRVPALVGHPARARG